MRAGRPGFARPCEGVHRSTSLMRSFLLLQQCPACLVHLTLIVFVMGGRWPNSCCFVGCCLQDLFSTTSPTILVELLSSFFSIRFVSVHVVHPYSSIDTRPLLQFKAFSPYQRFCKMFHTHLSNFILFFFSFPDI